MERGEVSLACAYACARGVELHARYAERNFRRCVQSRDVRRREVSVRPNTHPHNQPKRLRRAGLRLVRWASQDLTSGLVFGFFFVLCPF